MNKSNIIVSIIGSMVIIFITIIVINNFEQKEKNEDRNITLLCSNEYEDGEKVELKFIYDSVGKKLKKHILNHTEIDLNEEDEFMCNRFDLLAGIKCSFDKSVKPYKYTIEFNIDEFDDESREILNEYEMYNHLLSLSMMEAKKYLLEDENYSSMICQVFDENGNLIQPEKDDDLNSKKYIGEYYDTINPSATSVYTLKIQENGTYIAFVNFGIESLELSGTYTINENKLILSSSNNNSYKIDKTIFTINDDNLIFESGGINDEVAQNIGCSIENFDCSDIKALYKK